VLVQRSRGAEESYCTSSFGGKFFELKSDFKGRRLNSILLINYILNT
jgi:hypothetical protein